ncbi:MFS transporter [Streptomyces sp. NPDC059897]|uniref:MFS transporter n=1 Tax=Streptomyces sp. NPDC059897 TaxID=3346994 RepID=UPI003660BF03
MSTASPAQPGCRGLLRLQGAAAFFFTAAVGRIGIAMTGLGLVWLVHHRSGSYAVAGLVVGAFAVAEALAGPQLARLIDRFGQVRVLPPAVVAHAAAVGGLLLSASAPRWALVSCGALAGAAVPQLGALSAARWAAMLRQQEPGRPGPQALPTAFSLESMANGTAFLIGPVLVSFLGALGRPAAATAVATTLITAGGLGLAVQRGTAPRSVVDAAERGRAARTLLRPGFVVLVALNLAIGVHFGAMGLSVTAFVVERGAATAAPALFAAGSVGALLAGWLYGLRRWRRAPSAQLALATAALAAGCPLLLVAGSPVQLAGAVVVVEGMIPPVLVLFSVLTEAGVHRAVLTQALTWLNSASAAGSAAAAAVAGHAVDADGANGGFALTLGASPAMTVLAAGRWAAYRRTVDGGPRPHPLRTALGRNPVNVPGHSTGGFRGTGP